MTRFKRRYDTLVMTQIMKSLQRFTVLYGHILSAATIFKPSVFWANTRIIQSSRH